MGKLKEAVVNKLFSKKTDDNNNARPDDINTAENEIIADPNADTSNGAITETSEVIEGNADGNNSNVNSEYLPQYPEYPDVTETTDSEKGEKNNSESQPENNRADNTTNNKYVVELQIKRHGRNESLQIVEVQAASTKEAENIAVDNHNKKLKDGWECETTGRTNIIGGLNV